jgi:hypothetical protein
MKACACGRVRVEDCPDPPGPCLDSLRRHVETAHTRPNLLAVYDAYDASVSESLDAQADAWAEETEARKEATAADSTSRHFRPTTKERTMGTWRIVVEGHGIHHNGRQDDANEMAAVFVGELLANGHGVASATFELTNPAPADDLLAAAPHVESRNFDIIAGNHSTGALGGISAHDSTIVRESV